MWWGATEHNPGWGEINWSATQGHRQSSHAGSAQNPPHTPTPSIQPAAVWRNMNVSFAVFIATIYRHTYAFLLLVQPPDLLTHGQVYPLQEGSLAGYHREHVSVGDFNSLLSRRGRTAGEGSRGGRGRGRMAAAGWQRNRGTGWQGEGGGGG